MLCNMNVKMHMCVRVCMGVCRQVCTSVVYLHVCVFTWRSAYISVFCISPELWTKTFSRAQIKTLVNTFSLHCKCAYISFSSVCVSVFLCVVLVAQTQVCVQACVCTDVHACCAVMPNWLTGHALFRLHIQHFGLFSFRSFFLSPILSILGCY